MEFTFKKGNGMSGGNGEMEKKELDGSNTGVPSPNPEVVQGSSEKVQEKQIIPTDFKVCEVWIRSGVIHLDAAESFWKDKIRAIGLLDYCKDIVKQTQPPKEEKPKIMPVSSQMMNFVRNGFRKKGK